MIASIVNLRMREGAEVPTFIYSSKGGRDRFPEVRIFDEAGGEIRGIPTIGPLLMKSKIMKQERKKYMLRCRMLQSLITPIALVRNFRQQKNHLLEFIFEEEKKSDYSKKDVQTKSDSSSSKSDDEEQKEADGEPLVVERRPVRASTPVRPPPPPRKLGVKRNALVGAREFLLYGPATSPEKLEKTEIIQADKEKAINSKQHKPKDSQHRRSRPEKKPKSHYEIGSRPSAHPERKAERKPQRTEERVNRSSPRQTTSGGKKYREKSRSRSNLSPEERTRIMAERERNKPEVKVGMVKSERVIATTETEIVRIG
ncbi:hypothetical protein H4Q32_025409 [Labeo rohita]|uniref:Uncharacterized protein n=1 Tax=Labeo rohita TaxID=84645 RepID=A0ABQ8L8U5_LABRO|nr:hypothetical protein H4Q32_025409 [Labeo rohita]